MKCKYFEQDIIHDKFYKREIQFTCGKSGESLGYHKNYSLVIKGRKIPVYNLDIKATRDIKDCPDMETI
ncbi:MAG: hypothetical protein FWE31_01735 [Firmicutes bacterium]|nr:hypothetical protein [Bacillota bacterium]